MRSREQMFDDWGDWVFRSRFRRRTILKSWRALSRVHRATLANAVLVVRRGDGSVLTFSSTYGALALPRKELDGWQPIGTQVEEWLYQILQQASTFQLQAIDGTPGRKGVTFLYSADTGECPTEAGCTWLDAGLAPSALSEGDRRLLVMCK